MAIKILINPHLKLLSINKADSFEETQELGRPIGAKMGRTGCTQTMVLMISVLLCFLPTMVYSSNGDQELGFRVDMRHIDSDECSLLKRSQSAVERSKRRAEIISETLGCNHEETASKSWAKFQTPVHVGNGEFVMEIGYGTPAILSQGVMDTGSDVIWTQCFPCT